MTVKELSWLVIGVPAAFLGAFGLTWLVIDALLYLKILVLLFIAKGA